MAKKTGPNGQDEFLGTFGDDVYFQGNGKGKVSGGDGNDTLTGGNGKDDLNGDAGDDLLSGGNAKDLLNGGAGSDMLNGGIGKDTLWGGADADTFVFDGSGLKGGTDTVKDFEATTTVTTTTTDPETGESTTTTTTTLGDVIELHDLLQGYDAVTSNLSDFVSLTEVNGNTVVSIDRDGADNGAKFKQVVTLEGVTGLDEATVLAAGNIVVS
ncbi:MAG: type I secretion C-terminal target domain-containing protein [Alphaproteobacteria bacterium]